MDPTTTCCPHRACPARGQTGQGNMGIYARQDHRFLCTACPKTCTATQGTACYRLRVVDSERRIVAGMPARVETLRRRAHGAGGSNTAYIARIPPALHRARSTSRHGPSRARRA